MEDKELFEEDIEKVIKYILLFEFEKAEEFIKQAMMKDMSSPIPYNLLGVVFEYKKEILQAQKYYRASLALEPSYKAAKQNLERTVQWRYTLKGINFGGCIDEE